MTDAKRADMPPSENSARPKQGRRLGGAVGFAVVVAIILVYQLRSIPNGGAELPEALPLSSDPFSVLMPVPDLKFVNDSERPASLSDFKGRLVLLNIWATWCEPCRKEMPSLDQLQAKFDPSKFIVLTVSLDRAGLPAVRSSMPISG